MQLTVSSLSKRIGKKLILQEVSFRHEGGVMGIGGPNGSGKSTLMKCLAGLMKPSSGEISWQNGSEMDFDTIRLQLGYAAPYISHYPELTTRENLMFLAHIRNLTDPETRVDQLLSKTGIAHRADVRFGSLSSGQQQRVRLASALLHTPGILFLDEPGTNLDDTGRSLVRQIIDESRTNQILTLIASNAEEELDLCDQVFYLGHQEFSYRH